MLAVSGRRARALAAACRIAALACLCAALAGGAVLAQPGPRLPPAPRTPASGAAAERPSNEALFKQADKDQDGMLNRAEAEQVPGLAEHFEEIDTDKDGLLTIEEFKRGMTG